MSALERFVKIAQSLLKFNIQRLFCNVRKFHVAKEYIYPEFKFIVFHYQLCSVGNNAKTEQQNINDDTHGTLDWLHLIDSFKDVNLSAY